MPCRKLSDSLERRMQLMAEATGLCFFTQRGMPRKLLTQLAAWRRET